MILQAALLATSKVAERTLASGVLEHPSDPRYGKIMFVIDIPLPLIVGEAVEKAIVSTIKEEYFETERRSPLYQFEDTIKQINLSLAELAEGGHNDWVGHVHASIALWAENELFVAHAGRVLGVVARSGALVSFIETSATDRRILVHKTFTNLTSGQLSAGDTIIIGNGEMARHFSPQFLSQIAGEEPVESIRSMQAVARRLNLRFVTAIVGRVLDVEDEHERTETPAIVLESGQNKRGVPDVGAYTANARAALKGSAVFETIKAGAVQNAKNLGQLTKRALESVFRGFAPKKPDIRYEEPTSIDIKYSATAVDAQPNVRASATPMLARPWRQKLSHTLARIIKSLQSYLKIAVSYGRRIPPRVLLGIGIACVGIVLISVTTHSRSTSKSTPSKSAVAGIVAQATGVLDKASANASTKPDQAREELGNAQTLIDQIVAGGDQKDGMSLQNRYTKLIGQLNNVTVISPTSTTNLDSTTNNIVVIGQYLFSTRQKSPQLFRQTLGQADAPVPVFSFKSGTVQFMALLDEERKLLVGTTDHKLYRVAIDNQVLATELTPPSGETWLAFSSIASYGENLYLLEQSTGSIWKYTSRDSVAYTAKQAYLANQSLVNPKYTSIVSDGFIYALSDDGQVIKFLKGAPQTFGPTVIPKPGNTFQNAARLFTNQNTSSLFIQDAHRLIEITKDGQYVRQYVLSSGTISTSFISPKSKRAWFFTGSQLIETNL